MILCTPFSGGINSALSDVIDSAGLDLSIYQPTFLTSIHMSTSLMCHLLTRLSTPPAWPHCLAQLAQTGHLVACGVITKSCICYSIIGILQNTLIVCKKTFK